MHSLGYYCRTNVGIRYPHILCLAAVVTASNMRIAEKASHRCSFRVRFVAVSVQTLPAEMAFTAGNVERYKNHIAYLQLGNFGTDLHYFADKFVAESHAYAGVGHIAII